MRVTEARDLIMPELSLYCGCEIIAADHTGYTPDGKHGAYKITMPYGRGTGTPSEKYVSEGDKLNIEYGEVYRATFSMTAYSFIEDESYNLAMQMHDWFSTIGETFLSGHGIRITNVTDVINRDSILLDEYERKNGFDVIMHIGRTITKENADYFDKVELNEEIISKD